jgi:hypothetical protein
MMSDPVLETDFAPPPQIFLQVNEMCPLVDLDGFAKRSTSMAVAEASRPILSLA